MNIRQAIEWLQRLEQKHGSVVAVYFDCPKCKEAFTPDVIDTAAVHITAAPK